METFQTILNGAPIVFLCILISVGAIGVYHLVKHFISHYVAIGMVVIVVFTITSYIAGM